MTSEQEWKYKVWQRWLRISRRKSTAHISGDVILRPYEQRTMADAIESFELRLPKPKQTIFS